MKETELIDVASTLLSSRDLFLMETIDTEKAEDLCKEILVLNQISSNPITLWINCSGGSIAAGLSVIDMINISVCPIRTIICGMAGSMGALISVAGDTRFMTKNSYWMFHDLMAFISGDGEYGDKLIARCTSYYSKLQKLTENHLKTYTKLTKNDLNKARTKEVWYFAKECKKKGIVNGLFKYNQGDYHVKSC